MRRVMPLDRLVALQLSRARDIHAIGTEMRAQVPESLSKAIVQARLQAANEKWASINVTHEDIILRQDSAEHPYITEDRFAEMTRTYNEAVDWLLEKEVQLSEEAQVIGRRRPRSDDTEYDRLAKLPRLGMPSFSGPLENFDSFADRFVTLVDEDPRLNDTTKLQYLISCLKGPAAELVKDVAILGINYKSTWQALVNRFHNPRLTMNKYMEALYALHFLKKESAADLRAFVDELQRIVRALTNLKAAVVNCDMTLVYNVEIRLDPETRKLWESELTAQKRQLALLRPDETPSVYPKFIDLASFLEKRAETLSMIPEEKTDKKSSQGTSQGKQTQAAASTHGSRRVHHSRSSQATKTPKCFSCSGPHLLGTCPKFLKKSVPDRQIEVRRLKLCFNCLGTHLIKDCASKFRCKTCREKHHSSIHSERDHQSGASNDNSPLAPGPIKMMHLRTATGSLYAVNACNASAATIDCPILLATVQVIVIGPHGKQTRARALLDQGSEATFISEALVQSLGLQKDRVQTSLTGVGGCKAGQVKAATRFTLQSHLNPDFQLEVNAFVLPRLTSELPSRNLVEIDLDLFQAIPLADPEFHLSDKVDMLIGADLYGQLLRTGLTRFAGTLLVAQNTSLGWVISGPTKRSRSRRAEPRKPKSIKALRCAVNDDLSEVIQRFWTVEEIPVSNQPVKPMDEACEKLFAVTHVRQGGGHFQVRLPLTSELPSAAAEMRRMALGSLKHQQQRFSRDPNLERSYVEFMETYAALGHMTPVPKAEIYNPRAWYLPHHAVIQSTPQSSKIRVVFDASRKTRDKQCLNDFLMTGPPLQSDLPLILLNWRRYRYAFTADIVKMFRQIRVASQDQDFQRIVWSPSLKQPPVDYRLTTVTYGTACAPYLAIRTLLQLARDEKSHYPLGAACLETDTYVDDTFAGADELTTALHKRDELVGILESAGIKLDKWAANHSELLPDHARSNDNGAIKEIECDKSVKTLGIRWNPSVDQFSFSASNIEFDASKLTKRSIYSQIARLFDPLGWLAPITVVAKIIMQDLWIEKCEWDAPPSIESCQKWQTYCQSLSTLPSLSIDRWLGLSQNKSFEIHGFSDASSRAYAAVVYIRIYEGNGRFKNSLLTAKTKVAPVKTVSIPNLELCGATLLVKLVTHVQKLDFLRSVPVRLWSDSQIVLMWLKKHPCSWETFVANRVSLIQTELPTATWAHVPTKQNPADLATRGASSTELKSQDLWWHGPAWLASDSQHWPQPPKAVQALHVQPKVNEPAVLSRFSSLTRLIRVTAWCQRPFLQFVRRRAGQGSYPNYLTTAELALVRDNLVKLAQAHAFPNELALLRSGKTLLKRDPLRKLKPFLDHCGILRVGGRICNAELPCHVRYPPILPRNSSLSRLFVQHAHHKSKHGGPILTQSILLRFAWIVGMRSLVKTAVHKCVTCQSHKPRLAHQLMGDLPAARVTIAPPFTTTGLDYAGPFQVRTSKGRGQRAYKGYIALFVCFATKAIHLELVSDLTTATFIAAFRRFVSRRGICKQLYSDNATNFRGVDAELRAMFRASSEFYKDISSTLANDGTSWTFIPPTTPHYGGLWEAGVKSTKSLLKKTIGEHTLTFEDLSTVLAEIEACLNSRPLCQLTSDTEDLQALTPAHFLIGSASGVVPDEETPDIPQNRLDRFQLMQRIRDHFWKRWSSEYVLQLQERGKWQTPTNGVKIGQLVLLKDDRYPAAKWPLGRVRELHPGPDGHVRVVTVKTASNELSRHVACLVPLQLHQSEDRED